MVKRDRITPSAQHLATLGPLALRSQVACLADTGLAVASAARSERDGEATNRRIEPVPIANLEHDDRGEAEMDLVGAR